MQPANPTTPTERTWRDRLACFFGKHRGGEEVTTLHPYPDAHNCAGCGKLLYLRERATGLRYSSIEQFLEERTYGAF